MRGTIQGHASLFQRKDLTIKVRLPQPGDGMSRGRLIRLAGLYPKPPDRRLMVGDHLFKYLWLSLRQGRSVNGQLRGTPYQVSQSPFGSAECLVPGRA